MSSIFDIEVSRFTKVTDTTPQDMSLLEWLTTDEFKDKVTEIRSLQDEKSQKDIKKTLPCITPSGRFSYRDEAHLIEHSGFICFDVDKQDNEHILNFDELKEQISHFNFVAYVGISVRGCGYWGLVPIPRCNAIEHKHRFEALKRELKQYHIVLDPSGADVCRLRIASWDPDAYLNPRAKVYTKIYKPVPPKNLPRPKVSDSRDRVEALISKIKAYRIDITQSYDEEWLPIAAGLANEFGEAGRGYFHAISQFHPNYDPRDTDEQYDAVLRKRYNQISLGSLFHIAKQYGIVLKSEPVAVPPTKVNDPLQFKSPAPEPTRYHENAEGPTSPLPDIWNVAELEKFFTSKELPTDPVRLNDWTIITDVRIFTETHLAIAKTHNGNERYEPYYERLRDLKIILS